MAPVNLVTSLFVLLGKKLGFEEINYNILIIIVISEAFECSSK